MGISCDLLPERTDLSNKRHFYEATLPFILGVSLSSAGLLVCGVSVANATIMAGSYSSCTVIEKDDSALTKGQSSVFVHADGCNGNSETKVFSVANDTSVGYPDPQLTFKDLEVGKTYNFTTRGIEVPLLHSRESIIKIDSN